ncbi:MAG: sensor histidine kinase, partial [Acidimicrobiia bacterium]
REHIEVAPDFLSLMAHELSQPLTAALGSVVTIRDRKNTDDFEDQGKDALVDIAIRNLEQLQALLDSLRVFSEVEAGTLVVEKTRVTVEDLFREAKENFGTPSSGTRIKFKSEPDLAVSVELRLFRQVLTNVIANAGKFTPAGTLISVEARRSGQGTVLFTVRDEGPGVPTEEQDRIFKKSVRLQKGARSRPGTLRCHGNRPGARRSHLGREHQRRGAILGRRALGVK